MTTNDVANVIMASPGMGDNVTISSKTRRRNVLLLNAMIMAGLGKKDEGVSAVLLEHLSKESIQELNELAQDLMQKAGLTELNEAFKAVGKK